MNRASEERADPLGAHYDDVIIGSGAGGGTLAYGLAKRGRSVLLLERGGFASAERERWPSAFAASTFARSNDDIACVGGQTRFYGAALYRLRREDFLGRAHPDGASSPRWPIQYEDLEPYYSRAEALYHVHGASEQDPTEPPRSGPYPFAAIPHEPFIQRVADRLSKQGLHVSAIPRAIDRGPGGKCTLCTACDAYLCRFDAKLDAYAAAIAPALATGRLTFVTDARCTRLVTDDAGRRVVGAEVTREGITHVVRGDNFAVSGGIFESPSLLLRSVSAKHPRGLGNGSGLLGRGLGGHNAQILLAGNLVGRVPRDLHQKTFAVNDFYHGSPTWKYPLGVIQATGRLPIWDHTKPMLRPLAKYMTDRSIITSFMTELLPDDRSGVFLASSGAIERRFRRNNMRSFHELRRLALKTFRRAGFTYAVAPRRPELWHTVGTARFGRDPQTSVLDPWCRSHEVENLFVVDRCFMPSAGAINTALTIMAQALRVADHIAGGSA